MIGTLGGHRELYSWLVSLGTAFIHTLPVFYDSAAYDYVRDPHPIIGIDMSRSFIRVITLVLL